MKKILFVLMTMFAFVSCSIKQVEGTTRSVSVTGVGTVFVDADKVQITFSVNTNAKEPARAATLNAEKMNAVLSAIKELGIPKNDIATKDFTLYRDSKYRNGEYIYGDYVCNNSIEVSTKEKDKAGSIVDVALKAGANALSNFSYTCSTPEMAIKQARTLAVKNAYENANLIVGTSGNTLGKLITISELSTSMPVARYNLETAVYNDLANSKAATPLKSGKIEYTVTMSAKYEID